MSPADAVAAEADRAAPGPRRTLWAMVAAAGVVQLPTAAIVVAIPTIHAEFGTSIEALQWTVAAFLIPYAAFLVAAGRSADVIGRRRALVIGSLLFGGGSVLAAAAPASGVLIAGIALTGAGGAVMIPASLSILTDVFRSARRGIAIGLWGAATEFVSGLGILVGGVLTGAISWRAIFVVCLLFALAIIVVALRSAPESLDESAPRRIDWAGAVLSSLVLGSLSMALIQGPSWGFAAPATLALFAAAALLAVALVVVERRAPFPIIELDFLRRRNFAGSMVVIFVLDFSVGALLFFLPLYFQEVLDYSPLQTGLLLLPLTCLMVVGSPIGGRVAAALGPRPPIVVGLAAMAIGVYLTSRLTVETTYAQLWLPTALIGFGVGLALTPMNLAAMNAVSRDHGGAASGMLVTLSGLGGTLGVAVTGAIFNELQARRTITIADSLGFRIDEAQARQLDGVLAGTPGASAVERAAGVDSTTALDAVREAFVSALGTSLLISAALAVVALVITVVLMRREQPVDAAAHAAEAGGGEEAAGARDAPAGAPMLRPVPR